MRQYFGQELGCAPRVHAALGDVAGYPSTSLRKLKENMTTVRRNDQRARGPDFS
jgi:hypothetical protein